VKVEVGLKFEITFLTQHLGLSIFYPKLSSNNPALFRVSRGVMNKRVLKKGKSLLFSAMT